MHIRISIVVMFCFGDDLSVEALHFFPRQNPGLIPNRRGILALYELPAIGVKMPGNGWFEGQ
jgi:hypothetical protein